MSEALSANNKRIAVNTLLLYMRMIVVTVLSLVTVKYTLKILGNEDYGVYNIVGGVVTFLTFITSTVSSATQRFLAFELGHVDMRSYNNTFNMLLVLFGAICLFVFVALEAVAYPVVYEWLKIPTERMDAALTVYHLSVLTFLSNIFVIPYMSSIIANERMGVYAYITLIDTFSKLLLLGLLFFSPWDKLVAYAVGMLVLTVLSNSVFVLYNQLKISNTRPYWYWHQELFRRLMGYTGWSFFGAMTSVMCKQGLTILMNLFFGVAANAAKAVSDRINMIVMSFVTNFYMAVSPQITKTYAAGDKDYCMKIAFCSTRLSYYLMALISTPVILLADPLLHLWLDNCTADMVIFTQLTIVFSLVLVFETPVTFMMRATGEIKRYQLYTGCITLMVIPVSLVLFKCGFPAYSCFVCETVIFACVQFVRVAVARSHFPVTITGYAKAVLLKPLVLTLTALALVLALGYAGANVFFIAIITELVLMPAIWRYGLEPSERRMVVNFVKSKIKH